MATIKICLDAGHAGKENQSPVFPSYYESDFNWKLHLKLKKELEAYGIEVILTRKTQAKELGTKSRGRKAEGCNLFLLPEEPGDFTQSFRGNFMKNTTCSSSEWWFTIYPIYEPFQGTKRAPEEILGCFKLQYYN